MEYVIEFGVFIAVVCYFLSQIQKANQKIGKAYRDGFSAACNMQEPDYDMLNPLNAEMIKDNIEMGLSSGFDYSRTKLYKQGHSDGDRHCRQTIDMIIGICKEDLKYKGVSVHSFEELSKTMNRLR